MWFQLIASVFLAIKYAPAAMEKVCPEEGKTIAGGSIVVTASGEIVGASSS